MHDKIIYIYNTIHAAVIMEYYMYSSINNRQYGKLYPRLIFFFDCAIHKEEGKFYDLLLLLWGTVQGKGEIK